MERSKLKNIVLLLLLITNLILLAVALGRQYQAAAQARQARETAIALLQARGIAVEEAQVPSGASPAPLRGQRDPAREEQLAQSLLGAVTREELGGEVYRYSGSLGSIQFHSSGDFQASFAPGAFLLGEETAGTHAAALCSDLGLTVQVLEVRAQSGGQQTVLLRQTLEGAPVLNCRATLTYEAGSLTGISEGRWLFWPVEPVSGEDSASPATALMNFLTGARRLGDVFLEIRQITPAYHLSIAVTGEAVAIPAWSVVTDTGEYRLDLPTGEVLRTAA